MLSYTLNVSAINEVKKIYSESFKLLNEKRYREAERLFSEGLKKRPNNNALSLGLARCYQGLKKIEEANIAYQYLISINYEPAYKHYALFLEESGELNQACSHLEKFVEKYPLNADAYKMLSHSYEKADLYFEALGVINEGILHIPTNLSLYEKKVQILENKNQFKAAIEVLKTAIVKFPADMRFHLTLGYCYEKDGQYQEAEAQFQAVIKKFPNEDPPKRALKNFYAKQQLVEPAIAIYSTLSETYTNKVSYAGYLSSIGRFDEASNILDLMLEERPEMIEAYLAKAKVLDDLKQYENALAFYDEIKSKFPFSVDEVDLKIGYLELNAGNFDVAAKHFERLESFPRFELDALEAKAHLLTEQGAFSTALEVVRVLKRRYYEANNEYRLKLINRLSSKIYRNLKQYDDALEDHQYNISYLKGDIVDRFWMARIYWEKGDFVNAFIAVEQLIADCPQYQNARLLHAIILESRGEFDRAEDSFKKIFDEFPKFELSKLSYAKFLRSSGRFEEGIKVLRDLRETSPDYKEAALSYIKRLREMGELESALNEVDQICVRFPQWQAALLIKVRILCDMGQLDTALKLLVEITDQYPEFETAHIKRAMILEDMGKLDDAKIAFWNTYTKFPKSPVAVLGYIRVLMSIRDFERVGQCYIHLSETNSLSKEISLAFASFYGSTKRHEKADSLFESLLRDHPDYQDAFLKHAQYLYKAKRYEDAITEFENICKKFPDNPKIFFEHAQFWEKIGDSTQTTKAYVDLIDRFPQYQKGHLHFALHLATLPDKRKEADMKFQDIIRKFPLYLEAKIKYVQFNSWRQTWAETEAEYNKLLTKYPYSQSLHAQYIDFIWFQRDYSGASKLTELYKLKFKYNQYLHRKHILILIDDGKRAAIKQFKYATKKFPYNRKIPRLKHKLELLDSELNSESSQGNKASNNNNMILHQYSELSNDRKRKSRKEPDRAHKKLKI